MVRFSHVDLLRRTQEEYSYDLKRTIFAMIERRYRAPRRRRVLHDVSFAVNAGERIGLIGPNGSGKSTLLRVLAGILKPTSGTVSVSGSIAPLIELGAGFDPDLSVIENIMYYSVLLGRDRATARASIDGILDFAGLFDHANEPLKTLSSGMLARLGFAIATADRADILILDEVFAVGDELFRRRSTERIMRFWDERSTIFVVSHDVAFIRQMTDRAILLNEGAIVADGSAEDVTLEYARLINANDPALVGSAAHLDAASIAQAEGQLFRGNGTTLEEQKIFLIRDGAKHWIVDPGWLDANGIQWPQDVTFVTGGVLADVPEGDDVTGHAAVTRAAGYVERPRPGHAISPSGFSVVGWAYEGDRPWKSITVEVDGVAVGSTDVRLMRQDVCAALSLPPDLALGFEIACCLPAEITPEGEVSVAFFIDRRDGSRELLTRMICRAVRGELLPVNAAPTTATV